LCSYRVATIKHIHREVNFDEPGKDGWRHIQAGSGATALFPIMPGASKVRVKIGADACDLRIIGGQVINTLPAADKIDIITLAIQQRLTLKDLSKLNCSAQPWQSFMPAHSATVEACENTFENFAAKGAPFMYSELLKSV
jgi:hypothetical protein